MSKAHRPITVTAHDEVDTQDEYTTQDEHHRAISHSHRSMG